jgi:chaperone required for assembly of F1-ATPase
MKRFYKEVCVAPADGGFQVLLDGRPVRTPGQNRLCLPTRKLADAIAAEWRAQEDEIVPTAMPLLRLANTAIDGIAVSRPATIAAILRFGDSDLLCYRTREPQALAMRQARDWDPLLAWAGAQLGAPLTAAAGVTHIEQPPAALAALAASVAAHDDFALAGLHAIAAITGSLVLALAVAAGRIGVAEAFALSRIDEAYQAERWGTDTQAEARAERLAHEMDRASALIALAR